MNVGGLHGAAATGDLHEVRKLVEEEGHNPQDYGISGEAPIYSAAWNGHLPVVQYLIDDKKCDPNCITDIMGQTPLHAACRSGHLDVVRYLVDNKNCDPNSTDKTGSTPLHAACGTGHLSVVKYLVDDKQCDPKSKTDIIGKTPYLVAISGGELCVVQYLIDIKHCDPNYKDAYEMTPLHTACGRGDLPLVQYLVDDKKCNPNCTNKGGWTPLLMACRKGNLSVVRYLVDGKKCDPRFGNKHGWTPLHAACKIGNLSLVQYLMDGCECDPNCTTNSGWTPIHSACKSGHLSVVQYLMDDKKCSPVITDNNGVMPLHSACWKGCMTVIQYLIEEKKCDANCADNSGWTPLHTASRNGNEVLAQYLVVEKQCDVNYKSKYGSTPLHIACWSGDGAVIKLLLDHGADPQYLYTDTLKSKCPTSPGEAVVKTFMLGHPGAGKSTLTKALPIESGGVLSRIAHHLLKVSGVEQQTAGIIPHEVKSKQLGHTILFDLAGHEQFYASHDAIVQSAMTGSFGMFLVLANLKKSLNEFLQNISYWLSFVQNQAANLETKPHVLIVGTHSDLVSKQEKLKKANAVAALKSNPTFSSLDLTSYIDLDCRRPQSESMTKLRKSLAESYEVLRCKVAEKFSYHCFFIFLSSQFADAPALQLSDIITALGKQVNINSSLYELLPNEPYELDAVCESLHSHGRILYLRCGEHVHRSWIILNQHPLLARVNGTIFAHNSYDEHHPTLASSTGVVPYSNLTDHFPDINPDLLIRFLLYFEFCRQMSDDESLQILLQSKGTSVEPFFFFPALVRIDKPDQLWEMDKRFSYHTGWLLHCAQPEYFFTPRFLQVLLLRVAFIFALPPTDNTGLSEHPAIHRQCKVWKNGINWSERSGAEGLVEITTKQVVVLVRSLRGYEMAAVQARSAIIQVVLDVQQQFCPSVIPTEHIVHPDYAIQYPLNPELILFSCTEIAEALISAQPCVVNAEGPPVEIEKLLHFESYAHLGSACLRDIFFSSSRPVGLLLHNIADCAYMRTDCFVELFNPPLSLLHERLSHISHPGPTDKLKCLLELWQEQGNLTHSDLHEVLDKCSIFAGRNPLDLQNETCHAPCTSNPVLCQPALPSSGVSPPLAQPSLPPTSPSQRTTPSPLPSLSPSTSPSEQTIPLSLPQSPPYVDFSDVDTTDLDNYARADVLQEAYAISAVWKNVFLMLHINPDELDIIESVHWRFPIKALEEATKLWLAQAYDAKKYGAPSWRRLVEAIAHEAGGNHPQLAWTIALNHPCE